MYDTTPSLSMSMTSIRSLTCSIYARTAGGISEGHDKSQVGTSEWTCGARARAIATFPYLLVFGQLLVNNREALFELLAA